MKKLLFIITLFIGFASFQAQSRIALSAYKQITLANNKWGSSSTDWTSYASEGRNNIEVEITELEPTLGVYNLKYFIEGELSADFHLVYDGEKTATIRKAWNDQYVNCYSDENGDYVYVQGVSFQGLAKNPNAWATNSNSKIYMWLPSEKYAVLVK